MIYLVGGALCLGVIALYVFMPHHDDLSEEEQYQRLRAAVLRRLNERH